MNHSITFVLEDKYNPSDFLYGYSTNQNATLQSITNWQASPHFGLPEGTYLFFAKRKNGTKYFKKLWTIDCGNCDIFLISIEIMDDNINTNCTIQGLKPYIRTVTVPNCTIQGLKPYIRTVTINYQTVIGVIGLNV